MEFVKLKTNYYNDLEIVAAGEAAEVLFTRALAFAGDQESDGFIPTAVVARLTPTKTASRVKALVREGLWTEVDGGWVITGWAKHQVLKGKLDEDREATRQRVQAHRDRKRNAVTTSVTNAQVTPLEVEVEVEVEAAAAALAPAPTTQPAAHATELPDSVEILKAKLTAQHRPVRWDKITPEQAAQIEALIALHGDGPLIKASIASHRPDSPAVFAQAWIGMWEALPAPGVRHLNAVKAPRCNLPGHQGTTEFCVQCASEQKAAR